MHWIRHNWMLFSIIVLSLTAGWIIFSPPPAGVTTEGRIPAPREGFLAPDFELQDMQGKTVRLSDLRGQPVLINLWASWCPPCQAEMSAMQKVYDLYAPRGFVILAINTTFQDQEETARTWVTDRQLTFSILFDLDGAVSRKYQVRSMPTSFFVDKSGVIRRVVIGGPMPEGLLRTEVERMLGEAR